MSEFIIALAIGYVVIIFTTVLKNIEIMVTLLQEIEKHNRDISAATYRIEHRLDNHKDEVSADEE